MSITCGREHSKVNLQTICRLFLFVPFFLCWFWRKKKMCTLKNVYELLFLIRAENVLSIISFMLKWSVWYELHNQTKAQKKDWLSWNKNQFFSFPLEVVPGQHITWKKRARTASTYQTRPGLPLTFCNCQKGLFEGKKGLFWGQKDDSK